MGEDFEYVEPAGTTYHDWTGTAGAENSVIVGSGDLHELAGLSRDRWSILGINISARSHGADPKWRVRVFALDKQSTKVKTHDDLKALAEQRGSVPVTAIMLHDVSLDDVVKCMKQIHVQLLSPNFPTLDIVERGDHPAQG